MLLVDSNIWCYYFDQSAKEHDAVVKALDKLLPEEEILVNTVVIMEVSHFLVKNLGPAIGREKLEVFLSFPLIVVDFNYQQMMEALDMLVDYSHAGIGGRDATLLAAMKKMKIDRIMTHDMAFMEIDWVNAVDPIK